MWEDGGKVGERREHDEGTNEGRKGSLAAHVNAPEERGNNTAEHYGVEWVAVSGAHAGEEGREGCGIVAGKGPEDTAGG